MESNECICEQYYDKLRQALSSLLATTTAIHNNQQGLSDSGFVSTSSNFSFNTSNPNTDLLITSVIILGVITFLYNLTRRNLLNQSKKESSK